LTWLEGGSFKDICKSIFTGGLIGAAGGVFGGLVSKALTSVISRFAPNIASKLGNLLGFGAMGVHDSALEDVLYNRKIDWKKAIVTGGFSMALIFGGGKLAPPLVNFINDLPNPFAKTVVQTVDGSTFQSFANETIGDTKFGDFLNWFVKGEGTGSGGSSPSTPTKVDFGDQFNYTRNGQSKELKANVEFETPEGYNFKTDEHARLTSAEGDLQAGKTYPRNGNDQLKVGGGDRLSDDQGGHLIAHVFKGSGLSDNLVPMNGNLNKGAWKRMENQWGRSLKNGEKVKVDIKVNYEGTSQRPSSFDVRYKIGEDDWETQTFNNVAGG
ncbi:DNA/RNA non-specific endonuclease, partial [Thermoactinomyces sp. DSM 45892]|uniref:DNA/RNA non-specific endonuclease n=1 Tax=Thermoactinomyces sp. DSM 45892 TaxID=1882753 RepID=UPI0008996FC6